MLSIYKKYHLVTIVGSKTFTFFELSGRGEIKLEYRKKAEGRILSFKDDISYNTGILYMTDD